jgi:hypothetical protein
LIWMTPNSIGQTEYCIYLLKASISDEEKKFYKIDPNCDGDQL